MRLCIEQVASQLNEATPKKTVFPFENSGIFYAKILENFSLKFNQENCPKLKIFKLQNDVVEKVAWMDLSTMELLFGLQPFLKVEVELLYAGGELFHALGGRGAHHRLDLVHDHLDLSGDVGHSGLVHPSVEKLGKLFADGRHFR